jgi:hypothetical protein
VTYHDSSREEEYHPYLAQRHLVDYLWPLATALGLERVELLEVLSDYQTADNVRALLDELEVVYRFFEDPTTVKPPYPDWEHVQTRTAELIQRLQQVLAGWDNVQEVSFF